MSKDSSANMYESVFWDNDWLLPKYGGWKVAIDRNDLKILKKARFPFIRTIVLFKGGSISQVDVEIGNILSEIGIHDVVMQDFDSDLSGNVAVCGREFKAVSAGDGPLNIATYVVDLTDVEGALFAKVSKNRRNEIRKAENSGYTYEWTAAPDAELDQFYGLYRKIASDNKLQTPSRTELRQMAKGGNLLITSCNDKFGSPKVVSILYITEDKGFYLFGATDKGAPSGVGALCQWRNILLLKQLGRSWYDLGGVRSVDEIDGIHAFKKSFGGSLVRLGRQVRFQSKVFKLAQRAKGIIFR